MEHNKDTYGRLIFITVFLILSIYYMVYHILYSKYNILSYKNYEKLLNQSKDEYQKQIIKNSKIENKIKRLQKDNLDLDLLEEEIKKNIGVSHKNEIVIFEKDLNKEN